MYSPRVANITAAYFILYILAVASGLPNQSFAQYRDIVLQKSCRDKNDVCVEIDACPVLAGRFFEKKTEKAKRILLQKISCLIHQSSLKVCCPPQNVLPGTEMGREAIPSKRFQYVAPITDKNCGKRSFFAETDDESKATLGEFPWLAILTYSDRNPSSNIPKCGGSLISHRYVLTAAHCLVNERGEKLPLKKVRLGGSGKRNEQIAIDRMTSQEVHTSPREFLVRTSMTHPKYDGHLYTNDIGLVVLSDSVDYTRFISPICLPVPGSPAEEKKWTFKMKLTFAGWSLMNLNETSSDLTLRKLQLDYYRPWSCQSKLKTWKVRTDSNQLCAKGRHQNACAGDSGGPLMMDAKSKDSSTIIYQIGIVSYAFGGCNESSFAIYTKIQPYLKWIYESITNTT